MIRALRFLAAATVALGLATAAAAQTTPPAPAAPAATAQAPATQPAPAPAAAPTWGLSMSGFYEFNGYSQNNFFLGKDAAGGATDSDEYMIQLFRIQPELTYGKAVKAVLRIDLAQGIFGIDNEQRDNFRAGFSNSFNNKDTNFAVHLDWAYVELSPEVFNGWMVRLGRYKNQLGNLLVLDQSADGVLATRAFGGGKHRLTVNWTKQFEGADSLTDRDFGPSLNGKDADVFYVDFSSKVGKATTLNPYVAFYTDRGHADGTTYIPQGLQYNRARFTPNVTTATAVGLAFQTTAGKLQLKGEGALLWGEDKVANTNSGPNQLLDVNDGDLKGYTFYADAKIPVGRGTLGAVFGLGSGDDDPMSGDGNLVKIRTNGFFYVTEVWEDSIMPDEEGITPQGLGSPASRGYREFENTTLAQINYTLPINPRWKLFVSGTWMKATEPLRPWADANGNNAIDPGEFGTASSTDLGKEIDALLDWNILPNVVFTLRGGYMWAGDAAGYLLNGTRAFKDNPWELRTTLRVNFSGLQLLK